MKPLHVMHTAILVANLPRSQYFYGTVLGLPQIDRPPTMGFPGCWYQLGHYQIHLILDEAGDDLSPIRLRNTEKWGRNNHLAIAIADIDATRAHLQAHQWPMQASSSGRPAIFLQDPDGNVIELQVAPPLVPPKS
ncbi:MAG: VOC family protein [Leptolyngbyaceae bacterium]|nr:VOC family protein [Leptolyngbyaceae bacterium]